MKEKNEMNKYQSANLIKSGGFLLGFFYLFLILLNKAMLTVPYQGFNGMNFLYFVVITGILGIGYASKEFTLNKETKWKYGRKSWKFAIIGSSSIFVSLLLFAIQELGKSDVLEILGLLFMIIGNLACATEFFYLKQDLALKFEEEKVIKKPDYFMSIGFLLQALTFLIILIRYILFYFSYFTTLDIIAGSFAIISLFFIFFAAIKLNITFRAYPYMYEEEITLTKK